MAMVCSRIDDIKRVGCYLNERLVIKTSEVGVEMENPGARKEEIIATGYRDDRLNYSCFKRENPKRKEKRERERQLSREQKIKCQSRK